jgi:hypothetical protein
VSGDECRTRGCGLGGVECARCDPPKPVAPCTEESNAFDDGERCVSDDGSECAICSEKHADARRAAGLYSSAEMWADYDRDMGMR